MYSFQTVSRKQEMCHFKLSVTVWRDQKFWLGPGPEIWRERDQGPEQNYGGTLTGTKDRDQVWSMTKNRTWTCNKKSKQKKYIDNILFDFEIAILQ